MEMNNLNVCDIAIIDSGVMCSHKEISEDYVREFGIVRENNEFYVSNLGADFVGHGTAVVSIVQRQTEGLDVVINSYKILERIEDDVGCDLDTLLFSLNYILVNVQCKIVHMSFGVRYHSKELKKLCDAIVEKGIIIVSAFDNNGAISYPAAYDNVIGVDASPRCLNGRDFVLVKNSAVNIKAKGGNQRVAWVDPPYIINQGSSFAAPYVSSQILKFIKDGICRDEVLNEFEKIAQFIYDNYPITINKEQDFKANKVALFPYNKEMHSLINFSDLLCFEIESVYDIRHSGKVGQSAKDIFGNFMFKIKNVEECLYENIDTFIIGHVSELEIYTKKEYKRKILNKCLLKKINVYCFDSYLVSEYENQFLQNGLVLQYPNVNKNARFLNNFGRLHKIKTPVLGIYGTTMQQGKFTLQLSLKRLFINDGYNVGHLGTEPSGILFGCEQVYPFGYSGTVTEEGAHFICHANELMHAIDIKDPEIIIAGAQSGTAPLMHDNIGHINISSINFLLGTQPDAVILCVNIFDDLDYIKRTINTIIGLVEAEVICLALYPFTYKNNWYHLKSKREFCSEDQINEFKDKVMKEIGIKVNTMNSKGIMETYDDCISFFTNSVR